MTTNLSGRFSDCRNWTDFMYEEAAGSSLVTGDPASTIAASRAHLRLTQSSGWLNPGIPSAKRFFYANYAEGGACGGIPAWGLSKPALGTFKDQVRRFTADFQALYAAPKAGLQAVDWGKGEGAKLTLFLVWFGANDLYTAGCKPTAMAGVAEKVANKRRHELSRLVGAANSRFIFMNLCRPEASVRYQEALKEQLGTKTDRVKKFLGYGIEKELDAFRQGVDLFNTRLIDYTGQNGDAWVDIASVANPEVVGSVLVQLGLVEGAQVKGTSDRWVNPSAYDNLKASKVLMGAQPTTTSDQAHPTDRVYRLIWTEIKEMILRKQYTFGNLGSGAAANA